MQSAQRDSTKGFRFRPQFHVRVIAPGLPEEARTLVLNRAGAIVEWTPCPGCSGPEGATLPATCPLAPHHEATSGHAPCPITVDAPCGAVELPGTVRQVQRRDGHETVWIAFQPHEKGAMQGLEDALRMHLFASNLVLYEPETAEAERMSALWEGVGVPPEREESWFAVMRRLRRGDSLGVVADLDAFGSLDMGFSLAKSIYPSTRVIAFGSVASVEAARLSPVAADVDSFLTKPVAREAFLAALRRSAGWTGW